MPSRNLLLRSLGSAVQHLSPYMRPVTLRAGEVLNEPFERVEKVYFPVRGLISVRAVLPTGHELECALVSHTNALGGVSAINSDLSMSRDICLTEVDAWTINLHRLRIVMAENREVEQQVRRFSFAQLGYALQMGVCNSMHKSEARLARWLSTAVDLLGHTEIKMAQEELGKVLGVQRSALNPLLQRFRADGLIDLTRGRIEIRDRERLERRACDCRSYLRRAAELDATPGDFGAKGEPFGL